MGGEAQELRVLQQPAAVEPFVVDDDGLELLEQQRC